jgi:hypothetical protein
MGGDLAAIFERTARRIEALEFASDEQQKIKGQRGKTLGISKSKPGKSRLQAKKLSNIGTMSMVKGPGHLSKFKPPVEPGKDKAGQKR